MQWENIKYLSNGTNVMRLVLNLAPRIGVRLRDLIS